MLIYQSISILPEAVNGQEIFEDKDLRLSGNRIDIKSAKIESFGKAFLLPLASIIPCDMRILELYLFSS
jgi:hypothetical protein